MAPPLRRHDRTVAGAKTSVFVCPDRGSVAAQRKGVNTAITFGALSGCDRLSGDGRTDVRGRGADEWTGRQAGGAGTGFTPLLPPTAALLIVGVTR